MVPNMLPSPRFTSIRKNITDQNGEAGKWVMASVKAMKARPVPCTVCSGTRPEGLQIQFVFVCICHQTSTSNSFSDDQNVIILLFSTERLSLMKSVKTAICVLSPHNSNSQKGFPDQLTLQRL